MTPDTKTVKSEMTRTAIIGAALDLACEQGLEAI
jgi:AcrR family transcriptional regulator